MYKETARLIMYGNLGGDSILMKLSAIFEKVEHHGSEVIKEELVWI